MLRTIEQDERDERDESGKHLPKPTISSRLKYFFMLRAAKLKSKKKKLFLFGRSSSCFASFMEQSYEHYQRAFEVNKTNVHLRRRFRGADQR